jgi:RNA polymerase sigma factor (sigma-70 family)
MNINQLAAAARSGDVNAENELFSCLIERFTHITCLRVRDDSAVNDVVQEAMMTIVQEYKSTTFRHSFISWAQGVLNNRILRYIERRTRESTRTYRLDENNLSADPSNTNIELRLQLKECLKKLHEVNKRHALILSLRAQGYNTDEICGNLKMTRNSLYITLSRARRALERCLETGDIEHE